MSPPTLSSTEVAPNTGISATADNSNVLSLSTKITGHTCRG
jgi:hypothetical protein